MSPEWEQLEIESRGHACHETITACINLLSNRETCTYCALLAERSRLVYSSRGHAKITLGIHFTTVGHSEADIACAHRKK